MKVLGMCEIPQTPEILGDPLQGALAGGTESNKTREGGNGSGFGSGQEQPPTLPSEQEVQTNPEK